MADVFAKYGLDDAEPDDSDVFAKYGLGSPPSGLLRRTLGDVSTGLAAGTVAIPQTVLGLTDLVTGGLADRATRYLRNKADEAVTYIGDQFADPAHRVGPYLRDEAGVAGPVSDRNPIPTNESAAQSLNRAADYVRSYYSPEVRGPTEETHKLAAEYAKPAAEYGRQVGENVGLGGLGEFLGGAAGGMYGTAKGVWEHPLSALPVITESIPSIYLMKGTGGAGFEVVGNRAVARELAAGAGSNLSRMVAEQVAAGVEPAVAKATAEAAIRDAAIRAASESTAGKWAMYANEGAIAGGQNAAQVRAQVLDMPQAQMASLPAYQQLIASGLSPDEARTQLADSAELRAGAYSAVLSTAAGPLSGGQEALWAAKSAGVKPLVPSGLAATARRAGISGLKEGGQEFVQSGGEQVGQNLGMQYVDPSQKLYEGVGEQAVLGSIAGFGMGAVMSGGERPAPGSLADRATPVPPAPVAPATAPVVEPQAVREQAADEIVTAGQGGPTSKIAAEAIVAGAADQAIGLAPTIVPATEPVTVAPDTSSEGAAAIPPQSLMAQRVADLGNPTPPAPELDLNTLPDNVPSPDLGTPVPQPNVPAYEEGVSNALEIRQPAEVGAQPRGPESVGGQEEGGRVGQGNGLQQAPGPVTPGSELTSRQSEGQAQVAPERKTIGDVPNTGNYIADATKYLTEILPERFKIYRSVWVNPGDTPNLESPGSYWAETPSGARDSGFPPPHGGMEQVILEADANRADINVKQSIANRQRYGEPEIALAKPVENARVFNPQVAPQTNAAPAAATTLPSPIIPPAAPVTTPEVTSAQQAEVPVAESARQSPSPAPAANPAAAEVTAPGLAVEVPAAGQSAAPQVDRRAQATERVVQAITKADPGLAKHVQTLIDKGDLNVFTNMEDAVALVAKNEKISVEQATGLLQRAMQKNSVADPNKVQGFEFNGRNYHQVDAFENNPVGMTLHEATHARQRAEHDQLALDLLNSRTDYSKPVALRALLETTVSSMARVNMAQTDANGKLTNGREALTYLVEEAASWGRQQGFSAVDGKFLSAIDKMSPKLGKIIRDMVAGIRAYGIKHGLKRYMNPTVDDLVALAKANVRDFAKYGALPKGGAQMSVAGQQTATKTPEFKQWSRNAPVVSAKEMNSHAFATGAPVVVEVYHGSNDTSTTDRFSKDVLGMATGAKSAKAGFFFVDNPRVASHYAGLMSSRQQSTEERINEQVERAEDALYQAKTPEERKSAQEKYERAVARQHGKVADALPEAGGAAWQDMFGQQHRPVFGSGAGVMKAYVALQNPLVVNGAAYIDRTFAAIGAEAKKSGHDGLIIRNTNDAPFGGVKDHTVVVAFNPKQIKSATGNVGSYGQRAPTAAEAAPLGMTQEQAEKAQKAGDIRLSVAAVPTWARDLDLRDNDTVTRDGRSYQIRLGATAARATDMVTGKQATWSRDEVRQGVENGTLEKFREPQLSVEGGVGERGLTRAAKAKNAPESDVGHRRQLDGRYVGAPDWIGSNPNMLTKLRTKLRQLAKEGEPGRYWYENSSRAILGMVGGDKVEAEKIVGLIAIYSPNSQVPGNTTAALRAYYQWKAGLPIHAGMTLADTKADALLRKNIGWGGVKTNSFYQNLMVEIDPSKLNPNVATQDMWMAIAFDYGKKVVSDRAQYHFMEAETTRLAKELGWDAHQVQAAIWTAIKGRIDPIRDQLQAEELRRGIGEMYEEEGKQKYRRIKGKDYDHFRLAHEMGMAQPFNAQAIEESKYDFSNAMQERSAQIMSEAEPGTGTGILPGLRTAPHEQKVEYLKAILKTLYDGGKNLIAELAGIPASHPIIGVSAWEGRTGAGMREAVPVSIEGTGNARRVRDEARSRLNLYAALKGYILNQDAVPWHFPIYDSAVKNANGYDVVTARPLSEAEVQQFYVALHRETGTWALAPGYTDSGFRVLNFVDGLGNKEFHAAVERALSSLPEGFGGGVVDLAKFRSDGEYIARDAGQSSTGRGYADEIAQAQTGGTGRSDLQARADVLRARVEAVNADFAKRYGWDKAAQASQEVAPASAPQFSVAQTETPAFRNWFGKSVVTEDGKPGGKPLVVYHGTRAGDVTEFQPRMHDETTLFGTAFTPDRKTAEYYANNEDRHDPDKDGVLQPKVIAAYISSPRLPKVSDFYREVEKHYGKELWDVTDEQIAQYAKEHGVAAVDTTEIGERGGEIFVLDPKAIKSATQNNGQFDPQNPDIRFSISGGTPSQPPSYATTPVAQEATRKVGVWATQMPLKDRMKAQFANAATRWEQGILDSFAPLKDISEKAHVLARLSRASDAGLEVLLKFGLPKLNSAGALELTQDAGGFVGKMQKLKGEHDRFLAWIAGNRADQLMREGRENNLTQPEIDALKAMNQGQMADGSSRADLYRQVHADLNRYSNAVLDIAEKSGLINAEDRAVWSKDYYLPFFRQLTEEGSVRGPGQVSGLTRQFAFKKLKGGTEVVNDLLGNTLRNWSHLLSASLKNQAANVALDAAEQAGIAYRIKDAESAKGDPFVMENGRKQYWRVEDPYILAAVSAMEASPFAWAKPLAKFKRALTLGVTISPSFRIRNLIRDSLQAIGTNEMSYAVHKNLVEGWKATDVLGQMYPKMLAGGAFMHFGTEDTAEHTRRLVNAGVKDSTILNTPEKAKAAITKLWDWWEDTGSRAENINRAAIYKAEYEKRIARGETPDEAHLFASFAGRDLMDFSQGGAYPAIRLLGQVVPFFSARLVGMSKIGREGIMPTGRVLAGKGSQSDKAKAIRFGSVVGATTLAGIALMLAYRDDDEWKKRESWDRNNNYWFRIGDTAYRIPKPFEIGALSSLAEAGLEAMLGGMDQESRDFFIQRLKGIIGDQLSMNPIPQAVKPILDVYANKDSFTGRPIETMGMERLSKSERISTETSATAQLAGKATGPLGLSPVQIDELIQGYFGWLGAHAVMATDYLVRPAMGLPEKPTRGIGDTFLIGDFVKGLPANQSRFMSEFYDQARSVSELYADYNNAKATGRMDKAQELRAEPEFKLHGLYSNKSAQISKINQQLRRVQLSDLSPDEKRAKIDELTQRKLRIAEDAVNARRAIDQRQ